MSKFFTCLMLLAALAASTACDRSTGPVLPAGASAAQTLQRSMSLLREGNVAGFLENSLPPSDFSKLKAEWNSKTKDQSVSDETRQRYGAIMGRLTAADADDALFREYEPDIRQFDTQYKNQLPTILGMSKGYLSGMISQNQTLTLAEKQQTNQMLDALVKGVQDSQLTDPEKVRAALSVAIKTARELNLKTMDQALALNFDQAAPKLDIAFNGLKRLLEIYGFSINATLDSVKIEEIPSTEPDTAKLKVSYELMGSPVQTEIDMLRLDGRWYGSDTIARIKRKSGSGSATIAPVPR